MGKQQARLEAKPEGFLTELRGRCGWIDGPVPDEASSRLSGLVTEPFEHGRGKRKSQMQSDVERLTEMLTRQEKYKKYN